MYSMLINSLRWLGIWKDAIKILEFLTYQLCLNQTCLSMTQILTPIEFADIHSCEIWPDASGKTKL